MTPDRIELHDNLRTIEERVRADPELPGIAAALRAAMNEHLMALRMVFELEALEEEGPEWQAAVKAESDALAALIKTPCGGHAGYVWKMEYLSVYSSALDWGYAVESACADATYAYRQEREAA